MLRSLAIVSTTLLVLAGCVRPPLVMSPGGPTTTSLNPTSVVNQAKFACPKGATDQAVTVLASGMALVQTPHLAADTITATSCFGKVVVGPVSPRKDIRPATSAETDFVLDVDIEGGMGNHLYGGDATARLTLYQGHTVVARGTGSASNRRNMLTAGFSVYGMAAKALRGGNLDDSRQETIAGAISAAWADMYPPST